MRGESEDEDQHNHRTGKRGCLSPCFGWCGYVIPTRQVQLLTVVPQGYRKPEPRTPGAETGWR